MGNGNIINDKGDGKDKTKNNDEVYKNDNKNNLQEKIDKGRQELFHPIPQPQNKNKQNLKDANSALEKLKNFERNLTYEKDEINFWNFRFYLGLISYPIIVIVYLIYKLFEIIK